MKKIKLFVFAAVALSSIASAAAGTLKGKVIDKSTNEPLIGATVMVKGTTQGVVTDFDGNFELDLDRKLHTLSVSYVSYTTQELDVEAKGKVPEMMIQLESDSKLMDAVKVVAKVNLESEYAAIADQKNAIFATQVVGAKELSRKGVGDAQGAVMKVSGISKQEGVKNVFVRGLGDRYNSTTLNGLPIPSEDPEYKNISLDFFSTDVIQSVTVNKAFYAPGASDVGGANINISSKQLSGDGEFNISVSGGVNTQTIASDLLMMDGVNSFGYANNVLPNIDGVYGFENSLDPTSRGANFNGSVGLSGGKRFEVAGNPLTFYLIAGYDSSSSYIEEKVRNTTTNGTVWKDQDAAISEVTNSHLAMANVGYVISDKHSLDYNFMYIHSNVQSVGDYVGFDSEEYQSNDSGYGFLRRQQTNDNSLFVNQLVTKWELAERFDLEVAGSYNSIIGLEPDRRVNRYVLNDDTGYYTSSGDSKNQRFFSELNESDINAIAAVAYSLSSDEENISKIKVGYSTRVVDNQFNAMNYYHNTSNLQKNAHIIYDLDNVTQDDYYTTANLEDGIFYFSEKSNEYTVDKSIQSAYADLTLQISDDFILDLGVKYDKVDMDIVSTNDNVVSKGGIDESYFLPSLNLRYTLTKEHTLRFSASKTYTLPQVKEISPYKYVGASFTSQGSINLIPSVNYNLDLKWDWYISGGELLSVNGFYKYITDPIARIETNNSAGFLSYQNVAESAVAAGLEVEFRKTLLVRDLGDDKSNKLTFGFNGSYIYTNAAVDSATDSTGTQL